MKREPRSRPDAPVTTLRLVFGDQLSRLHIPGQPDRQFRFDPITDFGLTRSLISV
jgi:hypothetical protein